MKPDEISKVMQVYMLQNINKNSSTESSMYFELILQSMMDKLGGSTSGGIGEDIFSGGNVTEPNSSKSMGEGDIQEAISEAAKKYGVEREFIEAVIKQESSFNPNAVSKAGALGLMQLMPSTAKSLGVNNPLDVMENIDGGTRYLRSLMTTFKGNKELALAAYNGGIGRMQRLGVDNTSEISMMPSETVKYVDKVMKNYRENLESGEK